MDTVICAKLIIAHMKCLMIEPAGFTPAVWTRIVVAVQAKVPIRQPGIKRTVGREFSYASMHLETCSFSPSGNRMEKGV